MTAAPQPEPPRWPLWLPLAGFGCGLTFGLLGLSIVSGVANRTSGPGITDSGTVLVDISVVAACVLLAGLVAPPRPWQFGLRPAPLKYTAQITAIGALS